MNPSISRRHLLLGIAAGAIGCGGRDFDANLPCVTEPQSIAPTLGWPCYLGPTHDAIADRQQILDTFPTAGPRELWRRDVGSSYSSPVVNEAGLIVFYRQQDREVVECLDPRSGDSRWTFEYPTAWKCKYEYSHGPYGTPAIDDGVVYAVGAEGRLHALRMADGSLIWQRDLKADFEPQEMLFCIGSSPLIDGERLYFTLGGTKGNSGTICLNKRTGETIWTATEHAAGYATPVLATIHGTRYLFVFDDFGLAALSPDTGRVYWEIPFRSKAPDTICATSPAVFEDLVFVTLGPAPGSLCVRVLPDGGFEEVWREKRALDSTWNNVVQIGGFLYGYTSKRMRSHFRCVDFCTGKVRWSWESELERGSVIAVDGKLICFGEHGHLALLAQNPNRYEVLAITEQPLLPAPCYPLPALAQGNLYLKNDRTLVAYAFGIE